MRQTFSSLFYVKRRGVITTNQQTSIYVRITVCGESAEFPTGIKCTPSEWNTKEHLLNGKSQITQQANKVLCALRCKIERCYQQELLINDHPTAKQIKAIVTGEAERNRYILALFEEHNKLVKRQVGVIKTQATYQKYEVARKHLRTYILNSIGKEDILIARINYQFICGFELHLRTVGKCSHNTTVKVMQFFKRIVIIALNEGYIRTNPFANYKLSLKQVTRQYLTMDEVLRIANKQFSIKRLEVIRDLFVFAVFTGITYIDIKNLTKANLYADFDGSIWLRLNRQKTDEFSNIKLMDIPKAILMKYASNESDHLFPVPSNQKVNAYLKEIADVCGITKSINFHVARHTMSTTIALSNGMPIESLARMLGHSNIRTTQLYAKITDIKLSNDVDELNKRLEGVMKGKQTK